MDEKKYSLNIAGKQSLEEGVHKAVIFDDALELSFFEDGKLIRIKH
mgnify:CR=1 FL=1